MSDIPRREDSGLSRILESALLSLQHPVPADFARLAAARFERAFNRRHRRRIVLVAAATCLLSTVGVWAIVLDAFGIAGAAWDGLVAVAAFMGSVVTVWTYLPVTGVFFSMGMMALAFFALALLSRLESAAPSAERLR